jgi:hypothetical protein
VKNKFIFSGLSFLVLMASGQAAFGHPGERVCRNEFDRIGICNTKNEYLEVEDLNTLAHDPDLFIAS